MIWSTTYPSSAVYIYVYVPEFFLSVEEVATTLVNGWVIKSGGIPVPFVLDVIPDPILFQVIDDAERIIELINSKRELT